MNLDKRTINKINKAWEKTCKAVKSAWDDIDGIEYYRNQAEEKFECKMKWIFIVVVFIFIGLLIWAKFILK